MDMDMDTSMNTTTQTHTSLSLSRLIRIAEEHGFRADHAPGGAAN